MTIFQILYNEVVCKVTKGVSVTGLSKTIKLQAQSCIMHGKFIKPIKEYSQNKSYKY